VPINFLDWKGYKPSYETSPAAYMARFAAAVAEGRADPKINSALAVDISALGGYTMRERLRDICGNKLFHGARAVEGWVHAQKMMRARARRRRFSSPAPNLTPLIPKQPNPQTNQVERPACTGIAPASTCTPSTKTRPGGERALRQDAARWTPSWRSAASWRWSSCATRTHRV
jgi:hypothetical protein